MLQAGVGLADEGGIEAVTMRKLADELGVKAMSLYNHVANKDELLRGMVDAVWGEIALPGRKVEWKAKVRTAGDLGPRSAAATPLGLQP